MTDTPTTYDLLRGTLHDITDLNRTLRDLTRDDAPREATHEIALQIQAKLASAAILLDRYLAS